MVEGTCNYQLFFLSLQLFTFLCSALNENSWEILYCSQQWPFPRERHSASLYQDSIYIFGGEIPQFFNDVWKYVFLVIGGCNSLQMEHFPSPPIHIQPLSIKSQYNFWR